MKICMLTSSYPKYPGETTAPFIEEIAAGLGLRAPAEMTGSVPAGSVQLQGVYIETYSARGVETTNSSNAVSVFLDGCHVQNVGQQWNRAAESCVVVAQLGVGQTSDAAPTVGGAVNRLVMDDDELTVRAPSNVELQAVCATLDCFLE